MPADGTSNTTLDAKWTGPCGDLKPGEIRRIKLLVKFADGGEDDRLVDVAAGQQIRLAVPQPGPDKAAIIGTHPLTPVNAAAVSRDGRYIAVALEDRAVVLWDTAAGRPTYATAVCRRISSGATLRSMGWSMIRSQIALSIWSVAEWI